MKKDLVIFGTGEIGQLAKFYFQHDSNFNVVAFAADDAFIKEPTFEGLPVVPVSELMKRYPPSKYQVHVALSYNKLNQIRKDKYLLLKGMGYELPSYVCSKSVYWPDLQIGDNCFILENQTIQPTVKIGNNVMIWSGNHLGHGCEIKDHAYLSSHICISGHTVIGEQCFIGVNSTFKDFIKVGDRVFVTMGADVTKDVPSDAVILAAPSKVLPPEDEFGQKIRQRYFNL